MKRDLQVGVLSLATLTGCAAVVVPADPPGLAGSRPQSALRLASDKYSERTESRAIGINPVGRVRAVEVRPNGVVGWGFCGEISEQSHVSDSRHKVFLVLTETEVVAQYRDDDLDKANRRLAKEGCELLAKATGASTVAALPSPADAGPAPTDAFEAAKAHYLKAMYLHVEFKVNGVRGRVKPIQAKPTGEFGWGICATSSWAHYVDGGSEYAPYRWRGMDLLVWHKGKVARAFSDRSFDDLEREVAQDGCRYLSQDKD